MANLSSRFIGSQSRAVVLLKRSHFFALSRRNALDSLDIPVRVLLLVRRGTVTVKTRCSGRQTDKEAEPDEYH